MFKNGTKTYVFLFLILILTLSISGCITSNMKVPVVDPKTGHVILDQKGQPVMQELEVSDNGMYYRAISKRELARYMALAKKFEADKARYEHPTYNEITYVDPNTQHITTLKLYTPNSGAEVASAVTGVIGFGGASGSSSAIRPPAPNPVWGFLGGVVRAAASVATFGLVANSVENIVDSVARNAGTHIDVGNPSLSGNSNLVLNTGSGARIGYTAVTGNDNSTSTNYGDNSTLTNSWTHTEDNDSTTN